jgi:outer membrane protein assembly factor BamB
MRPRSRPLGSTVARIGVLLASAAMFLSVSTPSHASQASISISPSVGHPLERTVVTGSGFRPNEVVGMSFDRLGFGTTLAGPDGSFVFRRLVPRSAPPGRATVSAVGRQSGAHARARFLVRTNWPMFHGGSARNGSNPYENVLSLATVSGLAEAWSFTTFPGLDSSPAVVNDVLYVGSSDKNVYALDATTGAERWKFSIGTLVFSSPAVFDGVVYMGADDGIFYALDAATGAEVWSVATGATHSSQSSPVVVDGVVFAGAGDSRVHALDAATGAEVWSFATSGPISSSPAISRGVLYIGSSDDSLYALETSTGAELWRFTTGGAVSYAPAVADNMVFVGSADDHVYALDAATGIERWSFSSAGTPTSPSVSHGILYVSAGYPDRSVYALDATTGALRWTFSYGGGWSSPTVANGVLYIGSDDRNLYAVDAVTGDRLWSAYLPDGAGLRSTPAVANGWVYIGQDGYYGSPVLSAFHLSGPPRVHGPH